MDSDATRQLPGLAKIYAGKEETRRDLAALPFRKKLEILELMRRDLDPIRKARETRRKAERSAP